MKSIVKRFVVASAPLVLMVVIACTGSAEGRTPPTISPDVFAPIPTPRPFGQTPTPTATPFILTVPTVAIATPIVVATAEPTATPSATVGAPGPEPTALPTVPPAPTATAAPTVVPTQIPESTATPVTTAEPTSTPEPTATPTVTPVPVAPGGVVLAFDQRSIVLDPALIPPQSIAAGVEAADFSVAATFGNPVSSTFRPYSHGVKFRESAGTYQAVTINSIGLVRYIVGTVGAEGEQDTFNEVIAFGITGLDTSVSGSNSLHLTVIDDRAWLFVNDVFVTQFTVSGAGIAADIELVAELENETQIGGAATELTNVEVRVGETAGFIVSGALTKELDEISRTQQTGPIRDSVVEAEFVSPFQRFLGKWSVGFEFVDPVTGSSNWILINNTQRWKHVRQTGTSGELVEIDTGTAPGILRGHLDVNRLMVLARNGVNELYINGIRTATINIDPGELPAQISAIAGFSPTDQKPGIPTQFTNYTVWSFGS